MSNSKLVNYIDTTTGNYNTRKYPITRITIHHAAAIGNCSFLSSVLNSGKECSWNYGIGNDGGIGLFVEESKRAWTSSNADNDHRAVTIEVCNSTLAPNWEVSSAAWNSLINLCEDICRRNNIAQLTYTGNLATSNLTLHCWFTNTDCPGPYLKNHMQSIARAVNARLKSVPTLQYVTNPVNVTKDSSSSSSSSASSIVITAYDAAQLNYDNAKIKRINSAVDQLLEDVQRSGYLATADRTCYPFYASLLKNQGVVGVMLEAGYLYNSSHIKSSKFANPALADQIQSCKQAGLYHALYMPARARTAEEAKEECDQLYYVVSKYPPTLGIWLEINFYKSTTINNRILDVYYTYFEKWGLKSKCGIYCSKSQLSMISWDLYYDKFYLWLNEHTSDSSKLAELADPSWFKV